jgi:hypothetical protein
MSSQNNLIVKFKGHPELNIVLNDNHVARDWLKLFVKNYQKEFPIFRDQKKYTVEYLKELALQAKNNLNWNCETEFNNIQDTVTLHKCLEHTLQQGFATIPAEYDNLIHELHFCLHKIEYIDFANNNTNRHWLQIEWFNDDGIDLDINFQHSLDCNFGDLRLQNPYVGHTPLQVYNQNDFSDIMQTCKFHDFIRPGLYIHTAHQQPNTFNKTHYLDWWHTNASEFVGKHGIEKILHFTGHPVIGRVLNLNDLETIVDSNAVLELEYVFTK